MVNIRNIKGKYAFKHILFRKPLSYLATLGFFHNDNSVSPRDLFFSNGFSVVKTSGFGLKSIFEDFLSSLASVFILIADKQYIHRRYISGYLNIKFPLAQTQEGGNGLPPTDKSVGIRPTIL